MSSLVLVVEDEVKIAALLCDYLRAAGLRAEAVHDGDDVDRAVAQAGPDLVLLDLMLPGTDGLTLCRQLRADGNVPIIMLTARGEEVDRLLGLELGADDYITKPFSPREVVARVKAVLRRSGADESRKAGSSPLAIDEQRMRVEWRGERLDLTPVEFRLIAALARHPGRVYRRDELLDLIYDDYRDVSDRTVDSHIKNLRRKLAAGDGAANPIHSVYGIGYKLEWD